MIAYDAMLDVSHGLAQWLSRLLAAELRRRGTRKGSRALTCFRQAVRSRGGSAKTPTSPL